MPNLPISNASIEIALVAFGDAWDGIELDDLKNPVTVPNKTMRAALEAAAPALFTDWIATELNKLADEYDNPRKDDFEKFTAMRGLFSRTLRKLATEYQEGTR